MLAASPSSVMATNLASPAPAASTRRNGSSGSSSKKRAAEVPAGETGATKHKHSKSSKKHKKSHHKERDKQPVTDAVAEDATAASSTPTPAAPCLYQERLRLSMHLHPSRFSSVADGIAEQLNSSLLQYSDPLQGVLLTYSTPVIRAQSGSILFDRPHVNFAVEVNALVFRPSAGQLLDCVIHQVNNDHLSCLLYGCFTVTIDYYQIPPAYTYDYYTNQWRLESNHEVLLTVGSTVRVLVTAIDTSYDICTMAGSLRHLECGLLQPDASCYTLSQLELEQESPPLQTQMHQTYQSYAPAPAEESVQPPFAHQPRSDVSNLQHAQQSAQSHSTSAAAVVGKPAKDDAKQTKLANKLAEKEARRQAYIAKQRAAGHTVDEADVKIRLHEKIADAEKASAKKERRQKREKQDNS